MPTVLPFSGGKRAAQVPRLPLGGPATAASRALLPLTGLPRRTAQTIGAESGLR